MTHLLGKIDTFDALLRFKKDIVYLYSHKISHLRSRIRKEKKYHFLEKKTENISENKSSNTITLEEIVHSTSSVSKSLDSDPTLNDEDNKSILIKKRKLLEKIIYDAL
ncbi:MAG: hypothetical protein WCL02_04210 [bacterium]